MGLIGSDHPIPWDDFQKYSVPHGMGRPMGYPIGQAFLLQSTDHTFIYELDQVYLTLSCFDIYFTVKLTNF